MAKRVFSTVTLWLGLFAVLWFFRTNGALAVVTAVSALTLREFYRLATAAGDGPFSGLAIGFGAAITLAPWLEARWGHPLAGLLPAAVLVFTCRMFLERPPEKRIEALASTLFGLFYVAVMLQYFVKLLTPGPEGLGGPTSRLVLCLWVVAVTKFCDVGALLTGMAIGRHPLAPLTSPKKTWEGAVGGIGVAMGVGALVAWLGRGVLPAGVTPVRALLIAAPIAVVGIVSDLVESVLKRRAALKDSGGGIPGIGGIFDLSDSLILAAPLGYFLICAIA